MYSAGDLDQLIEIIRLHKKDDGLGGEDEVEQIIAKAWARVTPMRGYERFREGGVKDGADYKFLMYYMKDLKETDFIQWNGYRFNIRFIPDGGGRDLLYVVEAEKNAPR